MTKSRRYSNESRKFIAQKVCEHLQDGLIQKSNSLWRAQPHVVTDESTKKNRLCIDYSQTINKFTLLDGYPLPCVPDVVDKVAPYNVYSTLDMKSAYHQVELPADQQIFTAFEADGGLYQWRRIPLGLNNAVPCFQRIVDEIIEANGCNATHYLNNITVCEKTHEEHDANLKKFLSVARKHNLTLNHSKCTYSTTSIKLLGYEITNSSLKPDPDRIKLLLELPAPHNNRTLKLVLGLFAYYAQ